MLGFEVKFEGRQVWSYVWRNDILSVNLGNEVQTRDDSIYGFGDKNGLPIDMKLNSEQAVFKSHLPVGSLPIWPRG